LAAIAIQRRREAQTLNGIVHPLVAERRSELIAIAVKAQKKPPVIVEDIPLLVESGMAADVPVGGDRQPPTKTSGVKTV